MQQLDKQREAFEAWWFNGDYSPSPHKRMDICDEDAFEIWQTAQQELQAPLRMVDPIRQAMGLVNEWNEGAADADEWGNEACQAMFALSDCIKTLLIEAGTQPQWLPIETAPRDGTEILVGWNECSERLIVWWHNGWDTGNRRNYYEITPDVWMPLPPEPNVVD